MVVSKRGLPQINQRLQAEFSRKNLHLTGHKGLSPLKDNFSPRFTACVRAADDPTATKTQPVLVNNVTIAQADGTESETQQCVAIASGKIYSIQTNANARSLPDTVEKIQAPTGAVLLPGMIEQHIHGGFGVDFNTLQNPQDALPLLEKLPALGITALVPTLITDNRKALVAAIRNMADLKQYCDKNPKLPKILGIALEGPFLNPEMAGAHDTGKINEAWKDPKQTLEALLKSAKGKISIKWVTVAPEMPNSQEVIQTLKENNIPICIGHSKLSETNMRQAIDSENFSGITHLYNRLGEGITFRVPNASMEAVMGSKQLPMEIIADGVHVHPYFVKLPLTFAPANTILVSDAMALSGSESISGSMGGKPAVIYGNGIYNRSLFNQFRNDAERAIDTPGAEQNALLQGKLNMHNVLMASAVFVDQGFKNVMAWFGYKPGEASRFVSANPARFLQENDHIGQLAVGQDADLVLWDKNTHKPLATWINGQQVYQAPIVE